MANITDLVVPEWYRAAKADGASESQLKEQIRHYFLEATKRPSNASSSSETIEEEVISITFDMYEHAMSKV
jgi:hypothetical protein